MSLMNLNLTNEQMESFEQQVGNLKKPSVPNGSLLRLMYIGMDYTKSAKEKAKESARELTPRDGFGLEWLICGYYKPITELQEVDGKPQRVKVKEEYVAVIDYSNPDDVKFLIPGLSLKTYYYLNTKALEFAGYLSPKNDQECILLYNQLLERDLGISHKAEKKEGMIINAFRVMEQYYPSDQYEDPKTRKILKKDAKTNTKSSLTNTIPIINYREDGSIESVKFSKDKLPQQIEYISEIDLEKIYKAVINNEIAAQGDEPTPF